MHDVCEPVFDKESWKFFWLQVVENVLTESLEKPSQFWEQRPEMLWVWSCSQGHYFGKSQGWSVVASVFLWLRVVWQLASSHGCRSTNRITEKLRCSSLSTLMFFSVLPCWTSGSVPDVCSDTCRARVSELTKVGQHIQGCQETSDGPLTRK